MHEKCHSNTASEHYCWRCCYFRHYWGRGIDWRMTIMLNAAFLLPFAVVMLVR